MNFVKKILIILGTGTDKEMNYARRLLIVILDFGTIAIVNKKHQRTLESIFKQPVQSNVVWKDVEALMLYLNAEVIEGQGSRVRFALNGIRATFHRPHPKKETDKERWYLYVVS